MCIYSAVVEADAPEDAAEVAAADCPCDIDGEAYVVDRATGQSYEI